MRSYVLVDYGGCDERDEQQSQYAAPVFEPLRAPGPGNHAERKTESGYNHETDDKEIERELERDELDVQRHHETCEEAY